MFYIMNNLQYIIFCIIYIVDMKLHKWINIVYILKDDVFTKKMHTSMNIWKL